MIKVKQSRQKPLAINRRFDLRLALTNRERQAWNTIRPVLKKALKQHGKSVVQEFKEFAKRAPEKAAEIRSKAPWFNELLDMLGE